MKTSWNNTVMTDNYLNGECSGEEKVLFEARLLLEPDLKENLHWQKTTRAIVQQYGRQQLKAEVEQVAHHVFTAGKYVSFREKVFSLFK
ncbi:hypothetical protein [Flavobacterium beibuense]|uniref:hypothetical protein n=1 Tax=Flavobacterium beibuense TaxID=657326 RepID=UPI003A929F69